MGYGRSVSGENEESQPLKSLIASSHISEEEGSYRFRDFVSIRDRRF